MNHFSYFWYAAVIDDWRIPVWFLRQSVEIFGRFLGRGISPSKGSATTQVLAYWPAEGYDPVIPVLQQSKTVDCLVPVVRFGILVAAFISQELEPWEFFGAAAGNRPICDPNICCCCCCSFYCYYCCSYYGVRAVGSRPSFNALCFLLHCAKSVLVWSFDALTLNQFFQPLSVFV